MYSCVNKKLPKINNKYDIDIGLEQTTLDSNRHAAPWLAQVVFQLINRGLASALEI